MKLSHSISSVIHKGLLHHYHVLVVDFDNQRVVIKSYVEPRFGVSEDSVKGKILDTEEIERQELDIEEIMTP